MKEKLLATILILALPLLFSTSAFATLYGFDNITNTSATNAAIGRAQLSVVVTEGDGGQVLFTFLNSGPSASSICDVYFDFDGTILTGIFSINEGIGVDFGVGANPQHLPGGNSYNFDGNISAGSESPTQPNGVNPGETLGLLLTLGSGQNFNTVIAALNSGDLRIGIHIQDFANGGSESFINDPAPTTPIPVPEPATMLLLGSGLLGLGSLGKKFKK